MKEQWINDIHNKLVDHKQTPPPGLWEDIERTMKMRKQKKQPFLVRHRKLFGWSAAGTSAIAAMIAIAFLIGDFADTGMENPATPSSPVASAVEKQPDSPAPYAPAAGQEKTNTTVRRNPARTLTAVLADRTDTLSVLTPARKELTAENEAEAKQEAPAEEKANGNRQRPNRNRNRNNYLLADNTPRKRSKGKVSVSLSGSNLTGATNNHSGYDGTMLSTIFPSSEELEHSQYLLAGIMSANQQNDVNTRKKHKQPIKIGISVRYPLSERLSLESGLTYSYLSSELTTGSDSYRYETHQALQFVGIPLNVNYSLWKNTKWDFYVSAGGMVEKCVAGSSDTEYIVDGKATSSEHESTRVKPLQFSVNAAAGVQMNLTRRLGIYAEPGVNYYFDNGSPIETIYKEKPVNFNLRMGLRLSF